MLEAFGVINIWTYLAGLTMIILAPGPNSLYVLKSSSTYGVKSGYKAASAVLVGDAILILLSYLGIASLIQASPVLFTVIRYLGAAYLLYLGIKLIHHYWFNRNVAQQGEALPVKRENVFGKALTLSLTNPKAILFYVSFFIQFIDYTYEHTWISYLILAAILQVFSIVYLSFLIFLGSSLTQVFRNNQSLSKLGNSLLGLLFVGFAARLASLS
ncbi:MULTISPECIES: leucine efflux protein LeuE [Photobacterium]|uniref:Leucine export protein LeuE n=1 Tax=Photobacterium ganghwense TaxID=320778 RepID=A0A0J1H936_9GAMM|nr:MULTISPECIES: leucine efflux protein LeuE [Photobacterium]KLV08195.1 leucine export protein LeuE [Photobacterium ganghwense]MBV1839236.1 leucine efflux protein LeuE [Photobacterium ganghwense]PSU07326.1 leucine efflux protein LeuE [Photobacterium ganghwense]QSV16059.1 leucine efflux protein LeuE [Photobacterium ganghwense]